MNKNIREYVKKSADKIKKYSFYNKIVFIKDPLPEYINLLHILRKIEKLIPEHFLYNVDGLYIGFYQEFEDRDVNALYKDGIIYVSNEQDDNDDMVDDIVHEISHAFEETYPVEIYGDGSIENEFLKKRVHFSFLADYEGYKIEKSKISNLDYDREFDEILYQDIGYDKILPLTHNLFINPYALTSIREYFATGFEEHYLGEKDFLKKISPSIYKKIYELENLKDEDVQHYEI